MQTLIVLCAGKHMINGQPLFLSVHPDGKILAEKVIEGIQPWQFERIIYAINQNENVEFSAKDRLLSALQDKYPIEIVVLPEITSGPAETVYKTIQQANVTGAFAVRDCHNFIVVEKEYGGNYLAGLNLISYEGTIESLRNKSFIAINEQGQVLDIIEKKICSDVISVGLYGFNDSADFLMAYEHLSDKNYPIKKLYVSHIISFLIGYSERVFHSLDISVFEDWGTPSAWAKVQKKHTLCFVNLDKIYLHNMGMFDDTMEKFHIASKSGCQFVFYTSQMDINGNDFLGKMKVNGVNALQIVSGCSCSNDHLLIDSVDSLNRLVLEVG